MGFFKKKTTGQKPDATLQAGWQFYSRPTTLEPVGTVFRIDRDSVRYNVASLKPKIARGAEGGGSIQSQAEVNINFMAKLLGLSAGGDAKGLAAEKIEFMLLNPERESTADVDLDKVLMPFLKTFAYKVDQRYFVIRDCRWATAMTYRVSKQRILTISGEGAINAAVKLGARVDAANQNFLDFTFQLDEPMRVMFLPEEIRPVTAGLGKHTPTLGRVPVLESLAWKEMG
jgi:hypothetical protein